MDQSELVSVYIAHPGDALTSKGAVPAAGMLGSVELAPPVPVSHFLLYLRHQSTGTLQTPELQDVSYGAPLVILSPLTAPRCQGSIEL